MSRSRGPRQRGYALTLLVAAAGLFATTLAVMSGFARDDVARERRTAEALALARETLIGRAAADDTRPGSLPCPDVDNDGVADGAFGNCTAYLGRLPWRTLGLAELRDGWNERLWYALASAYRDNPAAGVLNSDTPGSLTVRDDRGTVMVADAPALVIAPGRALGSQTRGPGQQGVAAMYLDGENGNGDAIYAAAAAGPAFNDRLLAVPREALFRAVVARVVEEAHAALERYHAAHGYYPAASPYSAGAPEYLCDPATFAGRLPATLRGALPGSGCPAHAPWLAEFPAWFFDNDWHLLTFYAVAAACAEVAPASRTACTATGGAMPLEVTGVSSHARALVIVSGPARGTQSRPCARAADCIDDAANADGDRQFVMPAAWPAANDRLRASCADAAPCGRP